MAVKKKFSREEIRQKIAEDPRPVHIVAEAYGKSPTTVQKWRHRKDFKDRPRNPQGPPGIGKFGEAIFREMVRLSRYRRSKLFIYLKPEWKKLPSRKRDTPPDEPFEADVPGLGTIILDPENSTLPKKNELASITFYRAMKKCGLATCYDGQPPTPGTIAVHRVRVRWQNTAGKIIDGDAQLLMERSTGLIYAKLFADHVKPVNFKACLNRIRRMLPKTIPVRQLNFVSEPQSPNDERTHTSAFHLNIEVDRDSGERFVDLGKLRKHLTLPDIKVYADPGTTPQKTRIELPGTYKDKEELNKEVERLVNSINQTKRHYRVRGSVVEMAPLSKLRESLDTTRTTKSEEKIMAQLWKRIKLPLK